MYDEIIKRIKNILETTTFAVLATANKNGIVIRQSNVFD